MIKCKYCSHFASATKRYTNSVGDYDPRSRICPETGNAVSEKSKACQKFEKHSRFWCEKGQTWVDFSVCRHRRLLEFKKCRQCKQKKEIWEIEDTESLQHSAKSFSRGKRGEDVGDGNSEVSSVRRIDREASSISHK